MYKLLSASTHHPSMQNLLLENQYKHDYIEIGCIYPLKNI